MHSKLLSLLAAAALLLLPARPLSAKSKTVSIVYAGTYTGTGSEGIYAWRFDSASGDLQPLGLMAKAASPSFLAIAPNERFLYAVNEIDDFQGGKSGAVTAYAIDRTTGALKLINQTASRGTGPCFVSVDKSNRAVFVANYGGGSVASYRIDADGRLSDAVSFFQHAGSGREKAHAHSINMSPDNRFAIAADLGLDQLKVYKLNAATAELTPNDPPALNLTKGDGPRHFVFHPNGRFAYVINELHSTVTALTWDAQRGVLSAIGSLSTLPADFKGENSTAEVQVHPNGKWLYGSNRGHDSIAVFEINPGTGKLKLIQNAPTGGSMPRNFRLDPTGTWLFAANQKGNNINLFRIDPGTGRLTASGKSIALASPVCIKFLPMP